MNTYTYEGDRVLSKATFQFATAQVPITEVGRRDVSHSLQREDDISTSNTKPGRLDLTEFRKSAIPDALTLANIAWVEGESAIEIMSEHGIVKLTGHSQQYSTKAVQRILERYEFARAGGWVAYGQTIDGEIGTVACFKPTTPRSKNDGVVVDFSVGSRRIPRAGFGNAPIGIASRHHTPSTPPAKQKFIKYETPQGCAGLPLLAFVPDSIATLTWERYEVEINPDLTYWQNVRELGIDVTIVEGLKKALSLIAQGIPAIAIRGITMWHKKGSRELHEAIAAFATQERKIYICFDQDENPKTVKNVRQQAYYLGQEIEKTGAIARFMNWDRSLGKGIDDAIFNRIVEQPIIDFCMGRESEKAGVMLASLMEWWNVGGIGQIVVDAGVAIVQTLLILIQDIAHRNLTASEWLNKRIYSALTIKQFRRQSIIFQALQVLGLLEGLSYPVERETDGADTPGGYMPPLPPMERGAIHVVDAGLGSGKTVRIGGDATKEIPIIGDWLPQARDANKFTIVLAPMNSLGQQTGNRWGLPHIHDFKPQDSHLLWTMARKYGGVVLCPDSLHRLPDWVWDLEVVLVMDEANQICQGLTNAGTLGDRQSDILKIFTRLAEHATHTGAIVMAEDGIADRAVRFMETLSQAKQVRVFRHRREQAPWDCFMYEGNKPSGFRAKCLDAIASGKKIVYVASSQNEAERMDGAIKKRFGDSKRVTRIDGDTNENGEFIQFFNDPDAWLTEHQPDVLILSPSAKSGISIELPHFDEVWGYFSALSSDVHWQLLGRYRVAVPRHIYCPLFISSSADESYMNPHRAKRKYRQTAKAMAAGFGIEELITGTEQDETIARIEMAMMDYHSAQVAVAGAQKAIARDYLFRRLEGAGHHVTTVDMEFDEKTSKLWKQVQDEIWTDQAKQISALTIDEHHTTDWAYTTLNGSTSSKTERLRARKVLWRDEFPGVLFDDFEECYEGLCLDYGAMRKGVRLQAKAENLRATAIIDKERAKKILGMDIKAFHRLPKDLARARLIASTGVLELLDGNPYRNGDQRVAAIKAAALKWASEIFYWLRLTIDANQSGIEICHKLLRKLGIMIDQPERPGAIKTIGRPGPRHEKRARVYQIDMGYSPVRQRLLDAARQKLSGVVSTVCISESTSIQNTDTIVSEMSNPLPISDIGEIAVGSFVKWGTSIGNWTITAIDGAIATIKQVSGWAKSTPFTADIGELRAA